MAQVHGLASSKRPRRYASTVYDLINVLGAVVLSCTTVIEGFHLIFILLGKFLPRLL